ncbi:MAG: YHYH protein [Gemmataceae bacterium]
MMRCSFSALVFLFATAPSALHAHPGHDHQRPASPEATIVEWVIGTLTMMQPVEKSAPPLAKAFEPFAKKLKVAWDEKHLLVESNGMPDHLMMKGITNWQQQVPLPQPYTGRNAWRIPLNPVLADKPISAKNALFRGAIAVAVNGVPIFNALNNRGEDAFLIGELDEFGGHCGRADDYHYHAAPLHLQTVVGRGKPIAYALDGFPIYGLTEADGSPVGKLDEFNGKFGPDGTYRYHATKTYPYINGGLRGVVTVRGDQVEPQPRTIPVRPSLPPLRGARITGFSTLANDSYRLTYEIRGQTRAVEYTVLNDSAVKFVFDDGVGNRRTETYRRGDDRDPPRKGKRPE